MANTRKKRRWDIRRAMQGINKLWDDPDNTAYVFEIIEALPGRAQEKAFDRFLRSENGQRILIEQRRLLETLSNRAYLASLPEDSLGREYLAFVEAENISADGLKQASIDGSTEERDWGPERTLFGERLRDMHDLWHVVTGYQRDLRGEGLAEPHAAELARGVGDALTAGEAKLFEIALAGLAALP